jgi:hypothetical protein
MKKTMAAMSGRDRGDRSIVDSNSIQMMLDRKGREPNTTRVGSFPVHLTSLLRDEYCARKEALAIRYNKKVRESITGGHKAVWAIGRSLEKLVREELVASTMAPRIWGEWTCNCGSTYLPLGPTPNSNAICSTCGSPPTEYVEAIQHSKEHGVSGSPDLLINMHGKPSNGPIFMVGEIKSIKAEGSAQYAGFKTITEPMPDHVIQASAYRYLLFLAGHNVYKEVSIIYVSKDFKFGSPYKEFRVPPASDELIQHILTDSKKVADFVAGDKQDEYLPDREAKCTAITDKCPRQCPLASECFILND